MVQESLDSVSILLVIDEALFKIKLLSGSLRPDSVNQGSCAVEETSLDEPGEDEQEDSQGNVGVPHLNSIDVAELAWYEDGADGHGANPVWNHVAWEHGDKGNPPVRPLECQVGQPQVDDRGDKWDGVDETTVPEEECDDSLVLNLVPHII